MKHAFSLFIFLLCASGLAYAQSNQFKNVPNILPGFKILPAPNNLDKPGTIIAIDKHGVVQPLSVLALKIDSGTNAVGQDSGKVTSKVGLVLNFLKSADSTLNVRTTVKVNNIITYKIQLTGTSDYRIQLLDAAQQIEKLRSALQLFSSMNRLKDYKFYMISEAVKAKKIAYKFSGQDTVNVGLNASLKKIIAVNPSYGRTANGAYDLSFEFKEPMFVFAKYWELYVKPNKDNQVKVEIGRESN